VPNSKQYNIQKRNRILRYYIFSILFFVVFVSVPLKYFPWNHATRTSLPSVLDGAVKPIKRPNIIFITVDTLRADHLSCYGYPKNTSPSIDRFAHDAMLFENCFSQAPVTSSSFASMMTGFLPHETQVYENLSLPDELETLPEILQQLGYKTAAVISNFVLRKEKGWSQGFEVFDDEMRGTTAASITNRAIKLLKKLHNDRMFVWIHYSDPHGAYKPPRSYAEQFQNRELQPRNLRFNDSTTGWGGIPSYQRLGDHKDFHYYVSQYDGEIRYLDEHFKRLVETLKKQGLYDDALIIFLADHGEGMGEHDYYFAHGENLYNSLIHVPLIIKYGTELTGRRRDYVQLLDILPTVLSILGIEPDPRLRGDDLRKQNQKRDEIFSEMKSGNDNRKMWFSLISGHLKLIWLHQNNQYQLFDLKNDLGETKNMINTKLYTQHLKELKASLVHIQKENMLGFSIINKVNTKLAREEIKKLKTLGYVK
jgi:arylsulfatase A-like enzyme